MPRQSPIAARWNIDRLIAFFGGIEPLLVAHSKAGFIFPLTHSTIGSWLSRQSMPPDRLAELLVLARKADSEVDLGAFIVVEP